MKNIHVLPTDKPSRLHFDSQLFISPKYQLSKSINSIVQGKELFITSDEEIKEGDWCMSLCDDESYEEVYQCKDVSLVDKEDKKIILTTDKELIKDGVQAIDDNFLEWFVNNPSCEFVEVVLDEDIDFDNNKWIDSYHIILPKEDLTKCYCGHTTTCDCGPKEPKQETLEEAKERYLDSPLPHSYKLAVEFGAKWQQERSYSEEEVKNLLNKRLLSVGIISSEEATNIWFKQYTKTI